MKTKIILIMLFSLFLGMSCSRKKPVSKPTPTAEYVAVESTYFDKAGSTKSVLIEHGDCMWFETSGVWTGLLVIEKSKDDKEWFIDKKLLRPYFSAEDGNIQYQNYCLSKIGEGNLLPDTYYRFRMYAFWGGRCDYSFIARKDPNTPEEKLAKESIDLSKSGTTIVGIGELEIVPEKRINWDETAPCLVIENCTFAGTNEVAPNGVIRMK